MQEDERGEGERGEARPRVSRSNKFNISPVNPNPLVPVVLDRREDGVPRIGRGREDARPSHPTVPCRDDL